jgi:CelD/BcsL family acetyltransferase involved in cellulose biosynthesis
MLRARTEVGGIELLEGISDDARQLCKEANVSEPFYEPDWSEAYLRAFCPRGKLVLFSVWDGKRIRAFLPLILKKGFLCGLPVRRLTSCASVHSYRSDLVCCNGAERPEVLLAMWHEIRRHGHWDVLDLQFAKEGCGIEELLQLATRDRYSVASKSTWRALYATYQAESGASEPWLAGTHRKFRANLRRTRKELEELGSVSFRHFSSADPDALERFFQLESSGWKGREGTAIACHPSTRLYYELVATAASRDGYFSLDFLELNGKPISAHFALNWNGRYQLLKAAYDENYGRYGPGHLIVQEVLRTLIPLGMREIDFVAPSKWDETRWASKTRSHFTWFVFPRTLYGSILHFLKISGRTIMKSILRRPTCECAPVDSR